MSDRPVIFDIHLPDGIPSPVDHHSVRWLSQMRGQYADAVRFEALLAQGDRILYEVYELRRPPDAHELPCGVSIVHAGKVGDEYFMTKGHYHAKIDAAEVYYCLHGRGMMVMETPEGEWAVEELVPGRVLYVPPRWAHRSVNTHISEDLITFWVFPGDAGHDYATIEQRGFRKLVVERAGAPAVIDNPRWRAAERPR